MTSVVNVRTRDPYDVYVGRPSKWGNPFPIGRRLTREQAIERYRLYLRAHPELIKAARRELKDKILGCWCSPAPCHADILARVADGDEP